MAKPTDRTFYPKGEVLETLGWVAGSRSLDAMIAFKGSRSPKLQRALVCCCYAGQHCAVTARQTDRLVKRATGTVPRIPAPGESHCKPAETLDRWPSERHDRKDKKKHVREDKQHAENAEFVEPLWHEIETRALHHGLIVIAGATGSRKTSFAREFARRHIERLLRRGGDRPHIVTFEDPIESWFADTPEQASAAGFEYTPRQKGIDVSGLDEAVLDALRQKPALLYVNEVRNVQDWKSLLFFAGTGHLAVTTTHAGSLIETFERIFAAANAETPAHRAEIASRIVAVVHVKKVAGALVPTLWVQTSRGRMALTQEGLGALIPDRHKGCFGRAHFARHMECGDEVFAAAVHADLSGE